MARVFLAMSGGIDSSVSAVLLDVTGVLMRHGTKSEPAARPGKQGCGTLDDT